MNYKEQLQIQKLQLRVALGYAESIETCDNYIADGIRPEYFKAVREEAIEKYIDALGQIVEQSVEISAEFQKPKVTSDSLFDTMTNITRDYARANGIQL